MNNFELFSMMYFELDFVFEKQAVKDDNLAQYLSEINPFFWTDYSSADPAYFSSFESFMAEKTIGEDFGYSLIAEFLQDEDFYKGMRDAFLSISIEDFVTHAKKYLSSPHKTS